MNDGRFNIHQSLRDRELSPRAGTSRQAPRPSGRLLQLVIVLAAIGTILGVRCVMGSFELDPYPASADTGGYDMDDVFMPARPADGKAPGRTSLGRTIRESRKKGQGASLEKRIAPYELTGVMKRNGQYAAMVNGRYVEIGQEVDGATVVEIGPSGVKLQLPDKVVALSLPRQL